METTKIDPEQPIVLNEFAGVKPKLQRRHPLEVTLKQHDQTVDNSNFAMLKKTQGIHAPLRLLADRKAVSQVGRLPFLVSSNLHKDVIEGKDDMIGFEDFLNDPSQPEVMAPPHMVMEKSLGVL